MATKRRKCHRSRKNSKHIHTKNGGKSKKKTKKKSFKMQRSRNNCSSKNRSNCNPPCVWYPGIGCKERHYTPSPDSGIEINYNERGYHPNSYHREGQIDVATTNDSPPIQLGNLQPYYMLDRILDRLTFRELINFGRTNKEYKDVVREKIKKIKSLFRENGISDNEFVHIVDNDESLREYISYHRADEVKIILRYFPEYIHLVDDDLFWYVFRQNNIRIVRMLIRKIPYIGINTALIYASREGQIEMVKMLLEEEGADVNARNRYDNTPLMIAIRNGHTEIARMLIDRGADVNIKSNDGKTALLWASLRGQTEIVRLLIQNGADVSVKKDNDGNTALLWASRNSHIEIAELLSRRIADVIVRDNEGRTPLMEAIRSHKFIGEEFDNAIDRLLSDRKEQKKTDLARLLIDRGADINAKDKEGRTPLMAAISRGNIQIVRMLLDEGADVNIHDESGITALIIAVDTNNVATRIIIRMLLQRRVDVNAHHKSGDTPLMHASSNGYTDIARLLIEGGANVNIQTNGGFTALMYASVEGHTEIVKMLLDKGVDVNTEDDDGNTALMYASQNGHTEIVKLLQNPTNNNNELHLAVINNNRLLVDELLENKNHLKNEKNQDGMTPLMLALYNNNRHKDSYDNKKIVEHLLNAGVSLFLQDNNGKTVHDKDTYNYDLITRIELQNRNVDGLPF